MNTDLAAFRAQIDTIDDQLIALLKERIGIVGQVGELKRATAPGICPIRPGREAEMLRGIVAKFKDSPFQPAAAAAIWRTIIGMSTAVEAPLTLSVYAPDKESDLLWMAREYFGPVAICIRQPHVNRVIGDVTDGKASVGIVPMPRGSDTDTWWKNLLQNNDSPTVFARIPFVYNGIPGKDTPSALAIARLAPEASGDDCSLLVIEADENVSQNRLQTAFASAQLEANWITVATIIPGTRHHLVEIQGFVTAADKALENWRSSFGAAIFKIHFLGAYAVPLMLNPKK